MAQESVDEFYLSALFDDDEIIPISDTKYADALQLQEALVSSALLCRNPPTPPLFLGSASASASTSASISNPPNPLDVVTLEPLYPNGVVTQLCGTSHSFCEICADRKDPEEMFPAQACSHAFCSACVAKHVAIKLQEGGLASAVTCPGLYCSSVLEPAAFRHVLPSEFIARWEVGLCEALISEAHKFYCPYLDCSALMLNESAEGEIVESECPVCRRLFCAQCRVPWHSGVDCHEFRSLNKDERERGDLMIRELARGNNWNRCPHCKFYVEKTEGCLHITCRCGHQFCYGCGLQWSSTHGGCERMLGL